MKQHVSCARVSEKMPPVPAVSQNATEPRMLDQGPEIWRPDHRSMPGMCRGGHGRHRQSSRNFSRRDIRVRRQSRATWGLPQAPSVATLRGQAEAADFAEASGLVTAMHPASPTAQPSRTAPIPTGRKATGRSRQRIWLPARLGGSQSGLRRRVLTGAQDAGKMRNHDRQ